jgi:hypothetical protein
LAADVTHMPLTPGGVSDGDALVGACDEPTVVCDGALLACRDGLMLARDGLMLAVCGPTVLVLPAGAAIFAVA